MGTNAAGTAALGNQLGIFIRSSSGATVVDNMSSGNRSHGISLINTTNNVIQGNYVGTMAGGIGALGNLAIGINISTNANNNTIGGTAPGDGNIICSNSGAGRRRD